MRAKQNHDLLIDKILGEPPFVPVSSVLELFDVRLKPDTTTAGDLKWKGVSQKIKH